MSNQKYFYLNPTFSGVNSYPTDVQVELQSILTGASTPPVTITYPAGTALAAFSIVTLNSAGQAIYADANTPMHSSAVLGFITNSASAGDPVTVQTDGLVTNVGWGLTPGTWVYLGLAGQVTQIIPTNPATHKFIKTIGTAINADSILISLESAITLL